MRDQNSCFSSFSGSDFKLSIPASGSGSGGCSPRAVEEDVDIDVSKHLRRRKITPPPWSRILYIDPPAGESVDESDLKSKARNPFRKKLFTSVISNGQSIVKSCHQTLLEETFPGEDRQSAKNIDRTEEGNCFNPSLKRLDEGNFDGEEKSELKSNSGGSNMRLGIKASASSSSLNREIKASSSSSNLRRSHSSKKLRKSLSRRKSLKSLNQNSQNLLSSISKVIENMNLDDPTLMEKKLKGLASSHIGGTAYVLNLIKGLNLDQNPLPSAKTKAPFLRSLLKNSGRFAASFVSKNPGKHESKMVEGSDAGEERTVNLGKYSKDVFRRSSIIPRSEKSRTPVFFDLGDSSELDEPTETTTFNNVFHGTGETENELNRSSEGNLSPPSGNERPRTFFADAGEKENRAKRRIILSACDSGVGMDFTDEEEERTRVSEEHDDDDEGVVGEVLCGNRVSQMTRTYHDIEAVTRLLQEKEKDLELAARIGQQLLARNKGLEEKNAALEAELGSSAEKITQLRHELLMKTDLLQIYTNDVDESSVETTPTSLRHINVDLLQRRVQSLESENVYLREEASQLASDTQHCEEKEKELVTDVIKQLNEANLQVNQLGDELSKKIEDNLRLQEETTQLLAQVVELQATAKRLTRENEEYSSLVGVARECQQELTTELAELKEKYAEVLDLLHDTQEQLRRAQKKNFPGSRGVHLGGGSLFSSFHSGSDSIASELHSLSSGEEPADKADGTKSLSRVFDTVRLSSKLSNSLPPLGHSGGSVYSTPTKQASQIHSHLGTPLHGVGGRYSPYFGGSGMSMGCSSGIPSLDSGAESDGSFPTDSEDNYPASRPGVPGWPGTPDLDSCLRRLGPQDRTSLAYLPYGCRTPDSIMSTGSLKSGMSSYSGQDWKLPQKLQIVKPIEGSLTLHQWSRLATPHLGGLLEEKEGIAVKGATNADLNLEVYSMSDLEEDEEEEEKAEAESKGEEDDDDESKGFPGKQFMSTSGVFTYTNSTVLHPDELTSLTPSLRPSQMSALPTVSTVAPSIPTSTPAHGSSLPPSRRGSTATFSTNVGIAKHLRERGFSESHNSAGMAATATPANSPDESRACTPEPHAYRLPGLEDLTKHFHAGASFLRRTFYGSEYSSKPSSPPECSKINLMERVQAFGVERFVGPSGYPQSVGGVVTSRYPATPPLLQLSNLIRSGAKTAAAANESSPTASTSTVNGKGSIMSAPKITSPGERRPEKPMGAPLGIPGQPGAGHLDSRLTQLKPGQRTDLGTVGNVGSRPRPSNLGTIPLGKKDEKMGTVGWTSLGRKGGLL